MNISTTVPVATLTGLVDLLDPQPALITVRAIGFALAKTNRWAGNTEVPISTAQHSVLVMDAFRMIAPELSAWAIHAGLHDAHEYLIGDVITPLVKLLDQRVPGISRIIEAEKHRLDLSLLAALGVPLPDAHLQVEVRAAIHAADRIVYDMEWRSLMPPTNGASPYTEEARRHRLHTARIRKVMNWPEAEEYFRTAIETELALRPWERLAA